MQGELFQGFDKYGVGLRQTGPPGKSIVPRPIEFDKKARLCWPPKSAKRYPNASAAAIALSSAVSTKSVSVSVSVSVIMPQD